jgi:hypothetical protein
MQTPPPTELPLALGQLVLPWAEVHRPEAFQATMAVMQAGTPQALLNYLIRLVEVRWAEDPAWRLDAPLWALDLTKITLRLQRRATGQVLAFSGRRVKDAPWRFRDLAALAGPADLDLLLAAREALDLERMPS